MIMPSFTGEPGFVKCTPLAGPPSGPSEISYFEERVTLLYYYPNMHPDMIDSLVENGYRGIVIAGTGLGHVNKPLYPAIERASKAGVAIYMTVQTLWGFVHMFVYETGRDMQKIGVIPTENMLPEVAYIKLAWALGQTDDLDRVKEIMLTPICSEITEREPFNGYLIFQGGIPEVEAFLKTATGNKPPEPVIKK
jgi:glutamyl-tRNA(Gln) amidotransferase subunit D